MGITLRHWQIYSRMSPTLISFIKLIDVLRKGIFCVVLLLIPTFLRLAKKKWSREAKVVYAKCTIDKVKDSAKSECICVAPNHSNPSALIYSKSIWWRALKCFFPACSPLFFVRKECKKWIWIKIEFVVWNSCPLLEYNTGWPSAGQKHLQSANMHSSVASITPPRDNGVIQCGIHLFQFATHTRWALLLNPTRSLGIINSDE